jgi:pyruvate dehydrogenase E2 component (dihydrolipoamide acetyltransferase)
MPKLGLTMTEGVLAQWLVKPGDRVEPGQVMFVVETDKIANEIEAPGAGEIVEILVESGETVPVGAPLARWTGKGTVGGNGEGGSSAAGPSADSAARSARQAPGSASPAPSPAPSHGSRIIATPLARRMARQRQIDLSAIPGSGPRGRIKAADIETALARRDEAPPRALASKPAAAERVAVSSRHLAMARRVEAAKREIPHFYLTRRAEVSALLDLRRDLNAAGGPRITLNHLLLKAVGRALLACPEANRIWADDALLAFRASDVGMVVDTPDGLFIPMVRDAGRLPPDALAVAAGELIERTKTGALRREDLEGGAASVSNVGMAGGVESMAPIINPPQSSILGVGSVVETFRPNEKGKPRLNRELVLTLACDHRVFDGMSGARFLDAIVGGLETPHALLRTTKDG